MTTIWLYIPTTILRDSLTTHLKTLGHIPVATPDATTTLVLRLFYAPSYPPPDLLPTLVLVLSDNHYAQLLRLGYSGYLRPGASSKQLGQAIAAVLKGEVWAERHVLAEAMSTTGQPKLSPREKQVYTRVLQGKSNREIAAQLNISDNTVKVYVSALFIKLGARSRADLISQAYIERQRWS